MSTEEAVERIYRHIRESFELALKSEYDYLTSRKVLLVQGDKVQQRSIMRVLMEVDDAVGNNFDVLVAELHTAPVDLLKPAQRRARQLALTLLEIGEASTDVRSQLMRWDFGPTTSRDALSWAVTEHKKRQGEPTLPLEGN